MSVHSCCIKGFKWDSEPEGHTTPFPTASNQAYVTGSNKDVAVMFIADLFGWEFPNVRLLADHYAREVDATVFVPDFFNGESLPSEILSDTTRWGEIDVPGFVERNSRTIRGPELLACAKELRSRFRKVGAVGYCYGGWAVFYLGDEANNGLMDCVVAGHPSLLLKEDIDKMSVPVQMLAPEVDLAYTAELKEHTFTTLLKRNVTFDYQHFPGVEHACFTRGDPNQKGEREAMARGKNAAVSWLRQFLHEE